MLRQRLTADEGDNRGSFVSAAAQASCAASRALSTSSLLIFSRKLPASVLLDRQRSNSADARHLLSMAFTQTVPLVSFHRFADGEPAALSSYGDVQG
jgi:DNA-binding GntR family transcriptional regulator